MRAINVLKYLCYPTTRCNRKTLLPDTKLLIRSIIDYGSPIYGLTPLPSQLKVFDSVQNSSLRILTGTFRTSPACCLCTEMVIPPLHYHRLSPSAEVLSTSSLYPTLPYYNLLFHNLFQPSSRNSDASPNSTSTAHLCTRLNLKPSLHDPRHSYMAQHPPQVVLDLTQYPTCPTNITAYHTYFLEIAESIS